MTPKLGLDLAITPSVFSDFDQDSSKAFRLEGHGAAAWTWNETTKFVAGAAYLDRPDIEMIPIGGVIWTPNADVKFDLIFPHPKISRRIYWTGQTGDDVQDWVYIAGEFNGDAWAIRRADGSNEQVVLSDYRLVLGVERNHRRAQFAFRDRLRLRPPHPLQQRHARLLSHQHGHAPWRADVLTPLAYTLGMRTTIRLDDELLARQRRLSQKSGRTLSAFIEDSLQVALASKRLSPRRPRVHLPSSGTGGLRPGVSLDGTSELLDIMDEID